MPFVLLIASLLLFIPFSSRATSTDPPSTSSLKFIKNMNQWDKEILYKAAIPGGFLFVKKNSLQYVFYDTKALSKIHAHKNTSAVAKESYSVPNKKLIQAHGFEVIFEGANPAAFVVSSGESVDKKNFFLGNDPARWAANVPSYNEILYQNIYPGIDLKLYTQNLSLKYEFILSPQTNPDFIKLRYEGAGKMDLKEGFLQIQTTVNTVTETKPYCYQPGLDTQQEVPGQFVLKNNTIHFQFPEGYDKNQPLVIDPFLVFSTYSGSFTDNWGFTATFDEAGHLYSGGIEFGNGFPATNGAFQFQFADQIDVALLKYSPDGKNLLYATYLGGRNAEVPHSMIVNSNNELIVMGTTSSDNFPTTTNSYDQTFNGGNSITPLGGIDYTFGSDLFLTKFNTNGSMLIGSSYLGGTENDGIDNINNSTKQYGDQFRGEVNIDSNDNIYITSTTLSADFPLVNPSRSAFAGGREAVVCQFNPDLSQLVWSTYFGGSGIDVAWSIQIGTSGSVYICGGTTSPDLQVQSNTVKPTYSGAEDGYIAKFQNNALITATYIGTANMGINDRDIAALIDLDASENIYVMGLSQGSYPVVGNVYRNANSKQFIHAMTNDFTQTLFSTVIGSGSNFNLSPTAFMVSDCGFIYLSGWGGDINKRNPTGLPITPDAVKTTSNGDDFYLMILNTNASSLLYGTFFGGAGGNNHVDGGTSRFNKKGTIYHATCACRDNSTFPTTPGVWSRINNGAFDGGCNNVAFKFDLDGLEADFDMSKEGEIGVTEGCTPFTANFVNTTKGGKTYLWDIAGLGSSTNFNASNYTFTEPGEYMVTLKAYNPLTCKQVDSVSRKLIIHPANFGISAATNICPGDSTELIASGGIKYVWTPAAGLSNVNIANPKASPQQTTTYMVQITNQFDCTEQKTVLVEIDGQIKADFDIVRNGVTGITQGCTPFKASFLNKSIGGKTYIWDIAGIASSTEFNASDYTFTDPGEYIITLSIFNPLSCTKTDSLSKKLTIYPINFSVSPSTSICFGDSTQLTASGGIQYLWTPATGLSDSHSATPLAFPQQSTSYTVSITNTFGCIEEKTVNVEVAEPITLDFDLMISSECGKPSTVRFINNSTTGEHILWIMGNGDTLTNQTPDLYNYGIDSGTYEVVLKVFRGLCQVSQSKTIQVESGKLPPNVITPNGDQLNETFIVPNLGSTLEIYNRWGKPVYQSDAYQNDWGNEVPNGLYYYLLTSRQGARCKGWIHVLR